MKFNLSNGLEVVLEENHAAPVVAFQAWVRAGAADEPPALAGVSHFLEHMLFKGTRRRGVGQIAREVEGAGGEINAWTSYDETVFHIVMAGAFFDAGLDILSDALINSSFDPGELEREREVILEEVKQGLDDPDRVAAHALFDGAFAGHPYARPVIGSVETVRAMKRDDIAAYHHSHYTGANTTLVVVGDFDTAAARKKIEAAFATLPAGSTSKPRDLAPAQPGFRTAALARDFKKTQILFGFRIPPVHHEDIPALDLLAVALGQGDSSRLHLEIVRNRQLASATYSYIFGARDGGVLVAGATLPSGRIDEAARATLDEALRLTHEELPSEELARARTMLESDRVFDKETVQGYARKLGFFAAITGDIHFETRYLSRLAALTPADVRATAARYLRVANLTMVAQVPEARAAKQAERISKAKSQLNAIAGSAEARAQARWGTSPRDAARAGDTVVKETLPSGTKVLILRDPSVPIVSMRALWIGGLRTEDARSNGISNFIASLLTKGTRTRTGEQIMAEVEGMAGSIGGFAGRNSLGLAGEFLSKHTDRGLELFADCLMNAAFTDEEIDKERRIVLDDIRDQDDSLANVAFRLFHATYWKRHPYRLDMLGTADSVAALTRRKLMTHYRRHYGLSTMTLAIVGDVDPARVLARLRGLFAAEPSPEAPALQEPLLEDAPTAPVQAFRFLAREQAHLVLGYPGTTLANPDRFALEVLSQVLAGQGGRLFAEVREKRALAYSVSAFSLEGIEPGYFAVYVAASPAKLDEALAAIRGEIERLVRDGVTEEEFQRARRYLVGVHAIGLQRKSAVAASLAFHEAYGPGWQEYRRYPERIEKVKLADLKRVAARYLQPQREMLAVVKPSEETPAAAARSAAARAAAPAARAPSAPSRR